VYLARKGITCGIVGSIISNIGPIECASSICILAKTKSYKSEQDPYCKNDKHMNK
jgi:hypothetical protein